MFKKITTTAAIIVSGLAFSSASNANEISLEKFVSSMVNQAVSVTREELSFGVQKAVLTANNAISFGSSEEIAAKVTITDLESEEAEQDKAE